MHATMVCQALNAGKHVFVEKPLAMNSDELKQVEAAMVANPQQCVMVGFNRRFSPHMTAAKDWLRSCKRSKSIIITVNAGEIPADHWTQDPEIGGGRIIGEACHFVDLSRFLVGFPIQSATAFPMRGGDGRLGDCVALHLQFEDGSIATIHYLANGSKDFPKERIEVFAGGTVVVCDNFRQTREIGGQRRKLKTKGQDKGHKAELEAFINSLTTAGEWPISGNELFEVSQITLELAGASQGVTTTDETD